VGCDFHPQFTFKEQSINAFTFSLFAFVCSFVYSTSACVFQFLKREIDKFAASIKKVTFQYYIVRNEKKAEKSKIRKKWMIFNFQFVFDNRKVKNSDFVFSISIQKSIGLKVHGFRMFICVFRFGSLVFS